MIRCGYGIAPSGNRAVSILRVFVNAGERWSMRVETYAENLFHIFIAVKNFGSA